MPVPGALTPFSRPDRNGFSTTFREIKSDLLATRLPCRDAIFSAVDRNSSIFCALSIIFVMSRYYYFLFAAADNYHQNMGDRQTHLG
jgi:hypothetical protein